MMNLFSASSDREREQTAPLAWRMRPRTLDDIVGQERVVGQGTLLRRAIVADRLVSAIFYGPPGTGKTTLANVIAEVTKAHFETLNAVSSGVADIRRVIVTAEERQQLYALKTVLFIDEIHRFNKSQQDALLPHVEGGLLVLIGATTENPYFEVNPALVSRSHVFRLEPLAPEHIRGLLLRAIADRERGLGRLSVRLSEAAIAVLTRNADGDARRALNALELAALSTAVDADGQIAIDETAALQSVQERPLLYDRAGDEHYDTISAFIKSVRGSDADAALLWLAKMIAAGEDPKFIARRLVILASEDIGNADPHGLPLAVAALQAVQAVGLPEGRIALAQATTYLATAAKSNAAYEGIEAALRDVEAGVDLTVPPHLRGTGYASAAKLGSGDGYLYPHHFPGHWVAQSYWPQGVARRAYYQPALLSSPTDDFGHQPPRPEEEGSNQ